MATGKLEQAAVWLLQRAPRRAFSTLVGIGSRHRWPSLLQNALLGAFSRVFDADPSEAKMPLHRYENINEFFVRKLRPECRPVCPGDTVAVSPVDATLVRRGIASNTDLIQAKGIAYDLSRLLGTEELARPFVNGTYVTLWLKPGYYHRIHSPLSGTVREVFWIPGDRYPVVPLTVRLLPELYNLNERKVVILDTPLGLVAVVMVAALGVSNITLTLPAINGSPASPVAGQVYRLSCAENHVVRKGDELGIFELGSTVIVIFEPDQVQLTAPVEGARIKMGEPLAEEADSRGR